MKSSKIGIWIMSVIVIFIGISDWAMRIKFWYKNAKLLNPLIVKILTDINVYLFYITNL